MSGFALVLLGLGLHRPSLLHVLVLDRALSLSHDHLDLGLACLDTTLQFAVQMTASLPLSLLALAMGIAAFVSLMRSLGVGKVPSGPVPVSAQGVARQEEREYPAASVPALAELLPAMALAASCSLPAPGKSVPHRSCALTIRH